MTSCIAPRCQAPRAAQALFCGAHAQAPAGTRGGWLSAYKRKLARGNGDEPLDASNITRRLWIGGKPPLERDLPNFDVLVLCAEEIQPERIAFGRELVRVPLPDDRLTGEEIHRALLGGRTVATSLARGKSVLVTCAQGRNRSALVVGIALSVMTRMSTTQVVTLIRSRRRPDCLTNRHFVGILSAVVARRDGIA